MSSRAAQRQIPEIKSVAGELEIQFRYGDREHRVQGEPVKVFRFADDIRRQIEVGNPASPEKAIAYRETFGIHEVHHASLNSRNPIQASDRA